MERVIIVVISGNVTKWTYKFEKFLIVRRIRSMLQRSTATQSGIAIRKQVVVQLKIVLTSIPLRIFF